VPHIVNLAFPGIDAEDAIEALDEVIAVSTGAACTTTARTCSHVLEAMGVGTNRLDGVLRLSWCHTTEDVDWEEVVALLQPLMKAGERRVPLSVPSPGTPGEG
jgi:cysteine desulfurase